jgi:thiosulfate/3-mercaptopyruvate sulfurtransferase
VKAYRIILGAAMALVQLAAAAAGAELGAIVEPEWLQTNMSRPDVRVIDFRYGIEYYWQAHIPNAVHLYPDILCMPDHGVPVKLTPAPLLVQILGRAGVTESTTVVTYGEVIDSLSPYLTWALDYLGHRRHAILAGEIDRWRVEGRPLTQEFPSIAPVEYRLPAALHRSAVILDVRSPAMYRGETGYWQRLGHIPGAVNRPWLKDLNADYTWRSPDTLRAEYAKLGITPDKNVIICCSRGFRSTTTYLTLKHLLGYPNVQVYDGGFYEWASHPELQVETGP